MLTLKKLVRAAIVALVLIGTAGGAVAVTHHSGTTTLADSGGQATNLDAG